MFQVLDNSNMLQKINNNAKNETEYRKQNEKTEQMRLVKRRLLKSLLCQKKKYLYDWWLDYKTYEWPWHF